MTGVCIVVLIPAAAESAECVVVVTPSLMLMMRKQKKPNIISHKLAFFTARALFSAPALSQSYRVSHYVNIAMAEMQHQELLNEWTQTLQYTTTGTLIHSFTPLTIR